MTKGFKKLIKNVAIFFIIFIPIASYVEPYIFGGGLFFDYLLQNIIEAGLFLIGICIGHAIEDK